MVIDVKKEGWCLAVAKAGQLELVSGPTQFHHGTIYRALHSHLPCLQCAVEQRCGVSKRTWKAAISCLPAVPAGQCAAS